MKGATMDKIEWASCIRLMTYGLARDPANPMNDVDDAFKGVINRATQPEKRSFLEAIRAGLASDVDLSAEIGLDWHTDAVIREYLQAVEARLARELQVGPS